MHTGTTAAQGRDRQVYKRNGQTEKEARAVLRVRPSVRHRIHRNTRAPVPDQVDARERWPGAASPETGAHQAGSDYRRR